MNAPWINPKRPLIERAFDPASAPEGARLIPFLDTKIGECVWPLWRDDEPKICCGADVAILDDGTLLRYCAHHRAMSKGVGTPSEQRAHRTATKLGKHLR